jgi:RHS repeat-associated protein
VPAVRQGSRKRRSRSQRTRRLLMEPLEERRVLATIVWDGEAGDDNWHTAANWFDETNNQNDVLPAAADDVEIRAPFAGTTVLIQDADVAVNSLQSAAGIDVSGVRTLALAGTSQIDGQLELAGTIDGPGTLTLTSSMNWTGGLMNNGGATVIAEGAVLTVDATSVSMSSNRTLENRGTVNWLRGGLNAQTGAQIHNVSGALFDLQADVTLGDTSAPGPFLNEGIFRKSAGNGAATMRFPFESPGTIEIQSGTLQLRDGNSSGDILLSDGATLLQLGQGQFTFDVPAGKRLGRASGADQNVTFRVEGNTTVQGSGDFDVDAIELNLGTLNLARDVTVPHLELDGTIAGAGTLTVTESMDWLRGSMTDSGKTVIPEGAVLTIDATWVSLSSGRILENHGTVNLLRGNIGSSGGAQLHNMSGALFDVQGNAVLNVDGALVNDGVLRKSSSGGDTSILVLENFGTIQVQSGTLRLRSGNSTGDILLSDGATLLQLGQGQFTFDVPAGKRLGRASGADQNVTFRVEGNTTVQGAGDFDFDTIEVNLGRLNLARDVTVPHVELDGTIAGAGTLTVTESMDWLRGSMTDGGKTVIPEGAVLTADSIDGGAFSLSSGRTLENHGTINWLRGGLGGTSEELVHNTAGASFDIQANVSFSAAFLNDGILRKFASGGPTRISDLENSGTIEVHSGTLELQTGATTGDILLSEDTTLALVALPGGSAFTFDPQAGRRIGRATAIDENTTFRVNNLTTATIQGTGDFDFETIEVNLGRLNLARDVTVPHVELGGTIAGAGTLTVTESMDWLRGSMTDGGTTVIVEGAVLTADSMNGGAFSMRSGRKLENHGTVNWLRGGLSASDGAGIHNMSGTLFDIQADVSLGGAGAGAFVNAGTLRKSAGSGTTSMAFPLENTGTVEVLEGTLNIQQGLANFDGSGAENRLDGGAWIISTADPTVSSAAIVVNGIGVIDVLNADVTLDGTGISFQNSPGAIQLLTGLNRIDVDGRLTIAHGHDLDLEPGDLDNQGFLSIGPASTLSVAGGYTQAPDGALAIGLGGDEPSGQFGQLAATGSANLNGTFGVELFDGFGPTSGQAWDAMTFATANGGFAEFDGLYLGATRAFDVVQDVDRVVINAVADANDLAVDPLSVTVTGSGIAGEDVTVSYTVDNLTNRAAVGDWVDSVYLSSNAILDPFDILLGRIERSGGLAGLDSYSDSLTVPLPSMLPGNYRAFVVADSRGLIPDQNRADNTVVSGGTIAVQYQQIPIGGSVSDSMAAGEFRLYQVEVPVDASVRLTGTFEAAGQATVYTRLGRPASRSQFDTRTQQAAGGETNRILSLPGVHFVLVYGEQNSQSGRAFTLSAEAVVLAVSELRHARGGNLGSATATVLGTGFSADSTVELLDAGGNVVVSADVSFNSSRRLFATFDLVGVAAGDYDLLVTESGSSTLSPTPYTVTEEEAVAQLEVSITSPGRILAGRTATAAITFENTGGADLPAEVLTITSAGALMRLKGGRDAGFVRDRLQVLTVGDVRTGVIAPGERGIIYIDIRSIHPASGNELFIIVDRPEALDQPLTLGGFEDAFRPAHLPDDAWSAVFGNFTAAVGGTFGEYNDKVAENAEYLQSIGQAVLDVSAINRMELLRADNALPGIPLGRATDALASNAGLPLSFDRVYRQPISSRFRLGALGRGWMHNWETQLHEDEQGNLMLLDVTGSRFFQFVADPDNPAGGGIYVSGAGLEEVLRQDQEVNTIRLRRADGTVLVFRNDPALDDVVKPLLAIEESNGDQISVIYDNVRISELQHSNGRTLTLSYDANGRLNTLLDQAGGTTTFEYDATGEYLVRVTSPAGETNYTYDTTSTGGRRHALTSIENPDGTHTFYDYDDDGRLTRIARDGDAEPVTLSYPVGGEVVVTDAHGNSESLRYDARGRIAVVENADGHVTGLRYDEQTPAVAFTSHDVPLEHTGNLNRIILPDGREIQMEFDSHGNVTRIRDAAGEITTRDYVFPPESDGRSVVVTETSSLGSTFLKVVRLPGTLTNPQPVDNLSRYTDELGIETRYLYDTQLDEQIFSTRGNLTRLQYVDGSKEQFVYDAEGNLIHSTNRRLQSIAYDYDDRGLLTQKTHADGRIESFTYDARGNLTSMTDARGTTLLDYEAPDRLIRVSYPDGRVLNYTYDAAGNRTSISDGEGFTVNYTYDAAGRIAQVLDGDDALIVGYSYDAIGRISRQDNANGTFTTYGYDTNGRLSRIAHHDPDSAVRSFFDYAYDDAGRRESTTTEDGTTLYKYDTNNRLTEVALPTGRTITYQYDAVGNRLSVNDDGTVTDYVINDLQQYTAVGGVIREFDADGNLIREVDGGNVTTYGYDDEGRLIQVSGPDGAFTYEYDALGNRIAQTHDGVRTEYLVDPTGLVNVAAEYDAAGNPVARYVHSEFGLIARFDGAGDAAFYEFDSPGSTTAITDSSGGVLNQYDYLPFGEVVSSTEAVDNPFTYVGSLGVMQEGNGLHFMRARYYDSETASFTSLDPLRVPPLELYGYANDDPLQNVDPRGRAGVPKFTPKVGVPKFPFGKPPQPPKPGNQSKQFKDPGPPLDTGAADIACTVVGPFIPGVGPPSSL